MLKTTIHSRVEGGKLIVNRNKLAAVVATFENKEVSITVELRRRKRSLEQNAYYWGVVIELIRHGINDAWGHRLTKEETHEFLKLRFNAVEYLDESTGEVVRLPRSTTELTKSEFEDYQTDCKNFAKEYLGFTIPDPNEQLEFNT